MESQEAKIERLEKELRVSTALVGGLETEVEKLEEKVVDLEGEIERMNDAKKELVETLDDKIYDIKALLRDY